MSRILKFFSRFIVYKKFSPLFRIKIVLIGAFILFIFLEITLFNVVKNNDTQLILPSVDSSNNFLERLDIVDRKGILMARNIVSHDVYLRPNKMFDIEGDLDKLSKIIPSIAKRKEKLLTALNNKRNDPKAVVLLAQNIFGSDKDQILNNGIIGVEFQDGQRRIYIHNNIASHLLGFVNTDGVGISGIEKTFNNYLNNNKNITPLQLSIDVDIQALTRELLVEAMKKFHAKGATGIIMNVKTGEIITAISLPDFNPNNLSQYNKDSLLNRYSLGVYELGSVFKIFLATLATENKISWTKMYNTHDPFQIGKYFIHDFRGSRVRKEMNLVDIIKFSSNIGCARLVSECGQGHQKLLLKKLGLFEKLDIELPEKGTPIIPRNWGLTQSVTISYGHGIAVTPLHFIAAASAVVNNGTYIVPTFLKINNKSQIKIADQNIISSSTSAKIRQLLRDVIDTGAGRKGAVEYYDVGGKSGTAIQVTKAGYNIHKVILSLFAVVPVKDPRYVFYVTLEEPFVNAVNNNTMTGGGVVAPFVSEIISRTGPMLNIMGNLDSTTSIERKNILKKLSTQHRNSEN